MSSIRDLLSPNSVHNRTVQCTVDTVDTENGVMTLNFNGLVSNGRYATIPFLWSTFDTNKGNSAWGRYMPFSGDVVKTTFGHDDRPHVVGFDVIGNSNKEPIADLRTGYPAINRAYKNGTLPYFKPLNSGEFDFMSSGRAYIHGTNSGVLELAAGTSQVLISNALNEVSIDTGLTRTNTNGSSLRYGQVRRSYIGSAGDVAGSLTVPDPLAIWNIDGSNNEFELEINKMIGIVPISVARLALGAVTTEIAPGFYGPDVAFSTALPRTFALEVYDPTGLNTLGMIEFDNAGNTYSKSTASAHDILVSYKVSVGGGVTAISALPSGTIITSPNVNIGPSGSPVGGVVVGTQLASMLLPLLSTLAATQAAVSSALSGAVSGATAEPIAGTTAAACLTGFTELYKDLATIINSIQPSTSVTVKSSL